MKNAVRFPKLKAKTLKGKLSAYEKNWEKAEKAIKEGQTICLSDLIIQAEDIHLTKRKNTERSEQEDKQREL
jgi:hypothetical protein